jgi:hypothetical protein
MPSYTLNGATIELQPQDREPFMWLASQVYRRMHAGNQPPPLPAILTMFAHEGTTTQGLATDDPRIQAIMWTLWQLGLKGSRVEGESESKQIKWDKGDHAGIDAAPVMDCFTAEAIRDGRTLAASLAIAANRRINLNGTEIHVRINDFELIRAQSEEMNKRRQDEAHDPSMAAARYVAELVTGGADTNDLRLRAALELAADLGIRAMWVDTVSRQLRIAAFSREAALAAAFLQGAPVEHFELALKRADTLQQAADETARKLAAQVQAQQGGPGAARAEARPAAGATNAPAPARRRRR